MQLYRNFSYTRMFSRSSIRTLLPSDYLFLDIFIYSYTRVTSFRSALSRRKVGSGNEGKNFFSKELLLLQTVCSSNGKLRQGILLQEWTVYLQKVQISSPIKIAVLSQKTKSFCSRFQKTLLSPHDTYSPIIDLKKCSLPKTVTDTLYLPHYLAFALFTANIFSRFLRHTPN